MKVTAYINDEDHRLFGTRTGKPEEHGVPWSAIVALTKAGIGKGIRPFEMEFQAEAEHLVFYWENGGLRVLRPEKGTKGEQS